MASRNEKIAKALKGNDNGLKRGAFVAMLRRKTAQDPKKLERIVDTLLQMAEEGDLGAIRELSDRLDGKAIAAVEMSGPDGNPIEIEQAGTFAKNLLDKVLALKQKESDN